MSEMTAIGEVSDGYHTFNELYHHRHLLFISFMLNNKNISWKSLRHHDGSSWNGWFIAGMKLDTGDITYHLPMNYWSLAVQIQTLDNAPFYDGHTQYDVLERLTSYIHSFGLLPPESMNG